MMRYGDWVVLASFTLNILSAGLYAYQFHWPMVMYFIGAALINGSLIILWLYK